MRHALFAGLVLAVLPSLARAQHGPYLAVVADPEVYLRAGPSDKFPETGVLARGAKVVIEGEESGWVRVQAPQGSVSWVPIAFVDFDTSRPVPQNVMVSADVTLAPGRVGLPQPLQEVRKAKVPEGSILTVVGQKVTFDNRQWYPVLPPPGDCRYLPKSSVQAGEPVNTAFVVRDTTPPGLTPIAGTIAPTATTPVATTTPIAAKPGVNHPLWAQAEAAERDGRGDDAEKFYFQLARLMNEPGGDHDVANLCYTRIHSIREKKRTGGNTGPTSTLPPAASAIPTAATTSSPTTRPDRPTLLPPVRNDQPVSTTTPPASAAANEDRSAWTGAGMLVRTAVAPFGQQTYALESSPGVVRLYVIGADGLDMKPYINRRIDVYGTSHTRKDLSKPVVLASKVELAQ